MSWLYLLSVGLHILAATVWIGGMLFLTFVLVPALRKAQLSEKEKGELTQLVGLRLRTVGWSCLILLLLTGAFQLWQRGGLAQLHSSSLDGALLAVKLHLVGAILLLSLIHDFVVGPKATFYLREAPLSKEARVWRSRASWIGRANLLLALAVLAAAVFIVRGG